MKQLGMIFISLFGIFIIYCLFLQSQQNQYCKEAGGIPTIDGCLNPSVFIELRK